MPQSKINESLVCCQTVDKTEDRSKSSISFIQKTQKDINLLTSGKAPGNDSIPAKVCKDGSPRLSEILIGLLVRCGTSLQGQIIWWQEISWEVVAADVTMTPSSIKYQPV